MSSFIWFDRAHCCKDANFFALKTKEVCVAGPQISQSYIVALRMLLPLNPSLIPGINKISPGYDSEGTLLAPFSCDPNDQSRVITLRRK